MTAVEERSEQERKDALWEHVRKFMSDQKITCAETVYQSDRVIVNGYEFIDGCCAIVGYPPEEDE